MKPTKPAWKIKRSDTLTEKDLLRQCTDYLDILKNQGKLWYFHDTDSRRNQGGLPDLVVMYKSKKSLHPIDTNGVVNTVYFELKSPKGTGRLTEGQKLFNKWVGDCYIELHVTNNFDTFRNTLDAIL